MITNTSGSHKIDQTLRENISYYFKISLRNF